jgi:ketosteroid isomerase-like protein
MSPENRVALLEAFTTAWEARDIDAVMALMAEDCEFRCSVGPDPGARFVGRDEVRRGFELFIGSSSAPAPETETAEMLVNGNFAVTRWTLRWPKPDGSSLRVRGCDVFEFEGALIKLKDTYRKVAGELPTAG